MTMLARLRSIGERSIEDAAAKASAAREAAKARDAAELAALIARAHRAAVKLMGEDAPPIEGWHSLSGWSVIAPLGGPVMYGDEQSTSHDERYDGNDGELIFDEFRGRAPEFRYRPRLSNGTSRVNDIEHLARMIVARSIYG